MEESKKKLFDDNIFSHKTNFDFDFFMNNLEILNKELSKIKPFEFLVTIWELTKIFNQLGSSLSMAFSDITEKVNIWRSLFKVVYTDYYDIQSVIEFEIKNKIQELNGENNKDLGHKKGTPYYKYTSGARTLLRLLWFLDFMDHILDYLLTTNEGFSDCCKKAYDVALGIHHPWYVRSAAAMAMSMSSSSRGPVLKILFGTETWSEEVVQKLTVMHKQLATTHSFIKAYYTEKGLLELP